MNKYLCRTCGAKWTSNASMSCPRIECKSRAIERIDVEDEIKFGRSKERERIIEKYGDKDDI